MLHNIISLLIFRRQTERSSLPPWERCCDQSNYSFNIKLECQRFNRVEYVALKLSCRLFHAFCTNMAFSFLAVY